MQRQAAKYEFDECKCCKGTCQCRCCQGEGKIKTKFRIVHLIPEDKEIVKASEKQYDKMKEKYDKIGFDFLIISMLTVVALMVLGIITKSFIVLVGIIIPVLFLYLTLIIYAKSDDWWQKYIKVRNEIARKYGIEEKETFVLR